MQAAYFRSLQERARAALWLQFLEEKAGGSRWPDTWLMEEASMQGVGIKMKRESRSQGGP